MRIPKGMGRALSFAMGVALLIAPAAVQADTTTPLIKANPSNCSLTHERRYGSTIKNQCDSSLLKTIGPAENQVVTIDDTGFHPKELTIGSGGGLTPTVTFVNLGTQVHSATQLQSSPMWSMGALGVNVNGSGQKGTKGSGISKCKTSAKCVVDQAVTATTSNSNFDTGGITPNPGGTVQSSIDMGVGNGVAYVSFGANGDWVYSSYPDCIAADRVTSGSFDCSPAVIHVVDNQEDDKSLQQVLGPTVKKLGSGAAVGTVYRPLGAKDCAFLAKDNPIMAPGRTNACISAVRTNEFQKKPAMSAKKPYLTDPMVE